MILNIEITKEKGELLDKLAEQGHRSRRMQATKLLTDALDAIQSDNLGRSVPHDGAIQNEEGE